jgi:hypothetical protein
MVADFDALRESRVEEVNQAHRIEVGWGAEKSLRYLRTEEVIRAQLHRSAWVVRYLPAYLPAAEVVSCEEAKSRGTSTADVGLVFAFFGGEGQSSGSTS